MRESESLERVAGKNEVCVKKILWWIRELLFPRRCPVCDKPVRPAGHLICDTCKGKLKYISEIHCMKCGKPLAAETEEYCSDCKKKKHKFIQGKSVYEYKSAAGMIYRFKYGKRQEYAEFLGREMVVRFEEDIRRWKAQALIPVPIHKSRKRRRGYNQAELLAVEISKRTGIPVKKNLLVRCKKTVPLKMLKDAERQNNLKKAFKIGKNDVKLSTIIIIDDIYTTGSTVNEMADVLNKVGIDKIYVLTLAIGSVN